MSNKNQNSNLENNDIFNSLIDAIEHETFKPQPKNIKEDLDEPTKPIQNDDIETIIINNEDKQVGNLKLDTNFISAIGLSLHKQTLYLFIAILITLIILFGIYKHKQNLKNDD